MALCSRLAKSTIVFSKKLDSRKHVRFQSVLSSLRVWDFTQLTLKSNC